MEHIGLPCVLKDAHGGGWRDVYVCKTKDELIRDYDQSGLLTMVLQEFVHWEQFIRCMCLGQQDILPMKYDPRERKYIVEEGHLAPALHDRIVKDSLTLVQALGYDMNSIEWAVKDGVPYAIDFMNPAPDMDINSLTPEYFEWVVTHMADMVIRLAKEPPRGGAEAVEPVPGRAGGALSRSSRHVTHELGDAIARYHDGLTPELAEESEAWLSARLADRKMMFGTRPLCTVVRPRFLTRDAYRQIQRRARRSAGRSRGRTRRRWSGRRCWRSSA